jgi:SAM-dependent methyltransferase
MVTAEQDTGLTNADQIDYWNATAGETWAALQENLDRQIEPLGRRAMDALAPFAGERVIDIGCGCGQTTLELARRVGPSGEALGVDVSAPMLAVAVRRAEQAGEARARFLRADAQTHPFEPCGAEAVFSRFGVMFFSDPTAAFRIISAGLAEGGRLAFVCWRAMELNPFKTAPLAAAARFLAAPPARPDPDAPGPFAFAAADKIQGILAQAGFGEIELHAHDLAIGAGDLDQTVRTALSIGPLGAALREQPQLTPQVEQAVREALAQHLSGGRVLLDSASWIVTARKGARRA